MSVAACPACATAPLATELAKLERARVTLSVPDLRCAACIQTVERTLNALAGVRAARVNLSLKRVQIDTGLAPVLLIEALKKAGYAAYAFDAEELGSEADASGKDLILRLGVAGFAMMNVMLLSVAVWSGAPGATRDLFHLISAAIALPATAYAAQPFFRSALHALRAARLNMDVPISLAIVLAAGMSLYEALNGGAHAYFDAALSLTFFLLIGRVLEHRTRAAARSAAKELSALEVRTATRKFANGTETVPIAQIAVDDVILVPAGMRVPVDGILLSPRATTDRSFLTGESAPVEHIEGVLLCAGEVNLGAPLDIRTTAVGEDTSLRQIAALVETAEGARNTYTSLADRAARIYAPLVHLLAAAAFLGWWLSTGDVRHALNVAVAVLIITCPCALGLAVPAVTTAAIGRLYEMGFLVKSGTALERLAEIDTVVLDKTGTLTKRGFDARAFDLNAEEKSVLKALAESSAHPLARALDQSLAEVIPATLTGITEHKGQGVSAQHCGQLVRLGRSDWIGTTGSGLTFTAGPRILDLAFAERCIDGADALPESLDRLGISAQIISGDTEARTAALANRIGIKSWLSAVSPAQKHGRVGELSRKNSVCMIGDGVNDTAALASAHASVAPGTALDAARNAADIVLVRDTLSDVPRLFTLSRLAVHLSRQNFAIAALYNLIAVPIALAGFATPLLAALMMSTSSLTVLFNALRIRWTK